MQRLNDVLVVILQPLILSRTLLKRAVEAGILKSDGEVARHRFDQRKIFGRQILIRIRQTESNP